jgi:hypothetical protein
VTDHLSAAQRRRWLRGYRKGSAEICRFGRMLGPVRVPWQQQRTSVSGAMAAEVMEHSRCATQRGIHLSTPRRTVALLAVAALLLLGVVAVPRTPATAVNADQGDVLVSSLPAAYTPHVMNGSVDAITRVGNRIIAAGTFSSVSPAGTYGDTNDDVARSNIFAFNALTGVIDPDFTTDLSNPDPVTGDNDPDPKHVVTALATDGTSVYVAGSFGSVDGSTSTDPIRRLVKLDPTGTVDPTFRSVPNSVVNDLVYASGRLYIGGAFTLVRRSGTATARRALAALDPTTGAVLAGVDVAFTGVYDPANMFNGKAGGQTNVRALDVTPDGSRLVAIGNFSTVGGLARSQVVVLDVSGTTATVAPWATNRYDADHNDCGQVYDTFTRDVDISPDGSYFVVSATGAFAGGAGSGTLCDTTSRWQLASTGNDPVWIDYTGGDTTYGVAVTGGVVYVGGHMRWQNNPFQADDAGPGAVPREGIAALDPANGLPLSWDPSRPRGVGAKAMFATSDGLWVGSDTISIDNRTHGRIAFLPLAGGTTIPTVAPATLPNDLFMAQATTGGVLLRRPVRVSGAPSAAPSTANADLDWSTVRGAFLIDGTLYYGLPDGNLYSRSFDKVTGSVGTATQVNLYDDTDIKPATIGTRIPFDIAHLTGMFYATGNHRIYYTVLGDSHLYYRYFTPESKVVGAQTFTAATNGLSFATAAGATLAGGRIIYGSSTKGTLSSVGFAGGQVVGAPKLLSIDGTWKTRAMFVPN